MSKFSVAGALLVATLATVALHASGAALVAALAGGLAIGALAIAGSVARWVESRVPRDTVLRDEAAPRGALAGWFEANVNPLPHVWATLVRLSFKGQTTDPAALRQRPDFRVETWPIVGPMPCEQRTPVRRLLFKAGHNALRVALALPRNQRCCAEPAEVDKLLTRYFGEPLMRIMPPQRPGDLAAERLYEQASVAGFYHVRPNRDGTHSLDLQFLRDYPIRRGATRCGGEAVMDLTAGRLLHLVTPEDKVVTPDDPRFALEAFRFRSILFQWATIGPHSTWCHGMVAPKLFLATYALPEAHPLREFLKPFVFKVHENAGRSNVTVFGRTGVLWNVGAMTPEATQAFSAHEAHRTPLKTPADLHLPPYLRPVVQPLWDAIAALVNGFLAEFSIADDDPHVRAFRAFFAVNITPDFQHLSLSDLIVYCLFTSSVSHHLWGHIYPGTTDPRYVSVYARAGTAGDEGELMNLAEPVEWSVMRVGVVLSTRREVVKLSDRLEVATDDPRIKPLYRGFTERVQAVGRAAPSFLEFDRIATSGML